MWQEHRFKKVLFKNQINLVNLPAEEAVRKRCRDLEYMLPRRILS